MHRVVAHVLILAFGARARFEPRTRPDDPRVIRAIERLLGSPTRGLWF